MRLGLYCIIKCELYLHGSGPLIVFLVINDMFSFCCTNYETASDSFSLLLSAVPARNERRSKAYHLDKDEVSNLPCINQPDVTSEM